MPLRLLAALLLAPALFGRSQPPVILVDGWYPKCATAPRSSTSTFGQLEAKLFAMGITTQYFRPCSVPATPGFSRATIEDLGQALGALIDQTLQAFKATQVDVIGFSTGSPVIRAYLSGKQNAPGVFQPPGEHTIRKAVFLGGLFFGAANGSSPIPDPQEDSTDPGSRFLWDLNTWNQGCDDLRGIDAVAVAGQGQPTLAGSASPDGDGVHSLSSASLSFAYPAERTRIIKACHVSEVCSPTVSYVDSDSHPVWLIVRSFLTGTDEWKTVGSSPDKEAATYGGVVVGVKDASDNLIDASQVSLSGRVLDRPDVSKDRGAAPGLFFADQVAKGDYILQAAAQIPAPDVSFTARPGTYTVVTMKPGPLISSVVPSDSGSRQPSIGAGSAIEIRGARLSTGGAKSAETPFPTLLGGTTVTVNDRPIGLSFAGESQVKAILPEDLSGYVRMTVKTSEGVHSMNLFIDAKASLPPQVNSGGVVNNASYSAGASAPGEIAAVFGTNLTNGTSCLPPACNPAFGSDSKLNTTMAGAQVTVNNVPVPIFYAAPGQLGIQIPFEVTGTSATLSVSVAGQASTPATIGLAPVSPGIFTASADGKGAGAITHVDGSAVTTQNPAHVGELVVLYVTGLGQVSPAVSTGALPTVASSTVVPVTLTIGGINVIPDFAGLAGCCVGLNQINARVPFGVSPGNAVSVVLSIGGKSSNTATIAVQ
jgi:uncharacterized protein (TIGR03437 family)